jgi:hypothetical protein
MESGFFLRSSSSFFGRWLMKTANQLARRVGGARQGWASGGLTKTSRGKVRVAILSSSKASETWQWRHYRRVSLFYSPKERNGHPNRLRYGLAERSDSCHTGLDTGWPMRSRRRDRGRRKRYGRATLRRRTIVALK